MPGMQISGICHPPKERKIEYESVRVKETWIFLKLSMYW